MPKIVLEFLYCIINCMGLTELNFSEFNMHVSRVQWYSFLFRLGFRGGGGLGRLGGSGPHLP